MENCGNVIVVMPLHVFMLWFGSKEKALVANSDVDKAGTWRQFCIVIWFPAVEIAERVPCPWIGVVVDPSARVTYCFDVQG